MSVRRAGVILVTLATLAGLVMTVTGIDRDGSFWRGTGLVLMLVAVVVLVAGDILEGKKK